MITTTPSNRKVNNGECVGNVPKPAGTVFLPTMAPAIAIAGTIMKKRPKSIAKPSVVSHHGVLAFNPAKAEPLFPAPLVKAYRISLRPCGPALFKDEVPSGFTAD